MALFIITSILPILLLVIAIILSLKVRIVATDDSKREKTIAIISALGSLLSAMIIHVPEPIIYPLDGETRTFIDDTEITIHSDIDGLVETYYSLDGADPKEGNIYSGSIIISKSTTVCARNKFLWSWSGWTRETYRFEKLSYDSQLSDSDNETSLSSNNLLSENDEYVSNINITKHDDLEYPIEPEGINSKDANIDNEKEAVTGSNDEEPSESQEDSQLEQTPTSTPVITPVANEGQNPTEGLELMTYINQYRTEAEVNQLTWNVNLEQEAQNLAKKFATGDGDLSFGYYYVIARQCNGAKNAQRAVSDWITGNDYIPSEADSLKNENYNEIGGALYYLPNGNEYGYHYFWVICLM